MWFWTTYLRPLLVGILFMCALPLILLALPFILLWIIGTTLEEIFRDA